MNTKSEIGEMNAQLRGELKEHDDMDYETLNMSFDERSEALNKRDGEETERPPFGCSPACNRICTGGLNQRDLLIINRDFITLSRQLENATIHIETESGNIDVNVRRSDSVEPQFIMYHSQPTSKTASDGDEVDKEKVQVMNGVKSRIGGIMGKIKDGVLVGASAIKIWEFSQPVFLMVLSVLGCS